ncbi:MAG: carbohydrate-binding protein [Deltaproteobacteria bacterium]|nr:carbohydrate-binding protein [Deltaproteobacteria bacterium]
MARTVLSVAIAAVFATAFADCVSLDKPTGSGAATGGTTGGDGVTGVPFGPAQPMFSGVAGPYQKPDSISIAPGSPLNYDGLNLWGGGCCFGGTDGGDWAYYEEIDFGEHCAFDKMIVTYASPMMVGRMRVKLDNPQGPTVGEFAFTTPTGPDFGTLADVTVNLMPVSGKHFLLMQFVEGFGIGNFERFILEASGERTACPAAQ